MIQGLEVDEIEKLICEYRHLCCQYDLDSKGWISFYDYLILRTGIGLGKEIKLYKTKRRLNDIEEGFNE